MERLAPTPWTQDRYGNVLDADGERLMVSGVSLPCGSHPDAAQADAHSRLLTAAPDFYAAYTHERDTVSRLDWLSALLNTVDANFKAWAGDDTDAAYTVLQESHRLLWALRAAVAKAEGGFDA